jgi:hypothetical protein
MKVVLQNHQNELKTVKKYFILRVTDVTLSASCEVEGSNLFYQQFKLLSYIKIIVALSAPIVDVNIDIINQYRKDGMSWLSIAESLRVSTSALEKWKYDDQYQVRCN